MPVTARLSRAFYDKLGDNVVNELVDLLNRMDAGYFTELRQVNELTAARFEARMDQRFAEMDAKFEKRFAEMDVKFEKRFAEMGTKFEKRFAEQDAKWERRFVELETKWEGRFVRIEARLDALETTVDAKITSAVSAAQGTMIKWMVGLFFAGVATLASLMIGLAGLG